jgi:hypothetical protein
LRQPPALWMFVLLLGMCVGADTDAVLVGLRFKHSSHEDTSTGKGYNTIGFKGMKSEYLAALLHVLEHFLGNFRV